LLFSPPLPSLRFALLLLLLSLFLSSPTGPLSFLLLSLVISSSCLFSLSFVLSSCLLVCCLCLVSLPFALSRAGVPHLFCPCSPIVSVPWSLSRSCVLSYGLCLCPSLRVPFSCLCPVPALLCPVPVPVLGPVSLCPVLCSLVLPSSLVSGPWSPHMSVSCLAYLMALSCPWTHQWSRSLSLALPRPWPGPAHKVPSRPDHQGPGPDLPFQVPFRLLSKLQGFGKPGRGLPPITPTKSYSFPVVQ